MKLFAFNLSLISINIGGAVINRNTHAAIGWTAVGVLYIALHSSKEDNNGQH